MLARFPPADFWLIDQSIIDRLPPHHYSRITLYTDQDCLSTNMGLRKSFSKSFKKLKHLLGGGRHRQGGREGSEGNREGKKTDVGDNEAGAGGSLLHPRAEDLVESGPNREGNDVGGSGAGQVNDPPVFIPPISQIAEPDSTPSMALIVPSDNVDDPAAPIVQEALSSNQSQFSTTDDNRFDRWKSTASSAAKLFLQGVRVSADAFPPLKSVAGGLCFIMENCEV